ncbi:MAG TPA: heterodisulfide reductase-related iron-sulfur binding cluster [Candidatus Methylomirabilis sp.]|nr:heterodisulfide reductase-related iron-sulfur binding cluster [Candidatus Methylomirabilis sp.]
MTKTLQAGQGSAGKTQASPIGSFDRHDPPEMEKILDCVHCGFCLPTCPTYLVLGNEMDSPRGRIYLMRAAAEGRVGIGETFVKHMNMCLVCRACETACPSGVQFGQLMESARGQARRKYPEALSDRLFRSLILETFTSPERLRLLLAPLRLYQRLGIQDLLRRTGLLRLFGRWGAMDAMMPRLPAASLSANFPELTPAVGPRRGRVALLLGCAQHAFFPDVNLATARVLAANGFEVVAPRRQGCCGSLMVHEGEREKGKALARATIDAFEPASADFIAVNAAGCGSVMKEYGELLKDDPNYAARADAFGRKVRDVSQILAEAGLTGRLHPVNLKATYHDACHLAHGQRVRSEPRALLAGIPGLQLVPLRDADFCCGSAGIYNLLHPGVSREFLNRKLDRLVETGAQVVISGNPGCTIQMAMGLRERGAPMRAVHTVEVLDWSYRGVSP